MDERLLGDFKSATQRVAQECSRCVSEAPMGSLLAGFALGYLISHRTFRKMLSAQIKLLGALAGPAVTLYGAAKLWELAKNEAGRRAAADKS